MVQRGLVFFRLRMEITGAKPQRRNVKREKRYTGVSVWVDEKALEMEGRCPLIPLSHTLQMVKVGTLVLSYILSEREREGVVSLAVRVGGQPLGARSASEEQ